MAIDDDPDRLPERPWLALGVALALFAGLWLAVDTGVAAWDRHLERDWAVVRQTVPVTQGHGHVQEGGWSIDLALAPLPMRMMRDHTVTVRLAHRRQSVCDAHLHMRLLVPAMPMVDVTAILHPQADGAYVGRLILPLCSRTKADWVAQIRVDSDGRQIGGGFQFPAFPPSLAP